MESIGDEKRIRALFSEVRFADEQAAPSFTATWHRGQARAIRPRRAFNLSFVTATALLVFALGGLALWSRYSQPARPVQKASVTPPANDPVTATIKNDQAPPAPVLVKNRVVQRRQMKRSVRAESLTVAEHRQAQQQAKDLASWQSPTSSLLSSPSDNLFKSLPQLNENESEMKSFLPNRSHDKEK